MTLEVKMFDRVTNFPWTISNGGRIYVQYVQYGDIYCDTTPLYVISNIAVTDSHHARSHLQIADWTSFT